MDLRVQEIEIGVRYWSIETMMVVCRTVCKTTFDAALYAGDEQRTKKLLLLLDPDDTCGTNTALVLDIQLTTTPVIDQESRLEKSVRCEGLLGKRLECSTSMIRAVSEEDGWSDDLESFCFSSSQDSRPSSGENSMDDVSVASLATDVVESSPGKTMSSPTYCLSCTDDMDEIEHRPSESNVHSPSDVTSTFHSPSISTDDAYEEDGFDDDTADSDDDLFEWFINNSQEKAAAVEEDIYWIMSDLVRTGSWSDDSIHVDSEGPVEEESQTWVTPKPPRQYTVASQTDRTLKRLKVPQWNRNPSFEDRQPHLMTDSTIRTADRHLVEVGRQALACGLVKHLPEISKSTRHPQATGRDGLSWDENPTYSEDDGSSPHSQSNGCRPENFPESPMTAVTMTHMNSARDTHSRSGSAYFSNPSRSPSAERPWTHNDDELYEWMDVMITHDVGVQTDFEQEEEDDDDYHELIFSPVGTHEDVVDRIPLSKSRDVVQMEHASVGVAPFQKPTTQHQDVRITTSQADAGLSWMNKGESRSPDDCRRKEPHVGTSANVDPPSRDRPRHGCSMSAESDSFNNLPLTRLTEQPCSPMNGMTQEHRRTVSQELSRVSFARTAAVGRIDLLEQEVRNLTRRVTDLEIDLCNKESIIAQQDAVIHRFTSNLRTQRMHRRNFSAVPSVMTFTDTSKPSFESRHRSIHSIAEEPTDEVREIVHAQQELLRTLLEDLEKCRVA